jgi:hypothetical protein
MKEGLAKTNIFVPFGMGGKRSPIGGPVANQFIILCCGSGWEMGDPCIDPSYRIWNICTVHRNFITNKEILGDIFFNPSGIVFLFFNAPSSISHLPNLMWRFLEGFTKRGSGEEKEEKDENDHKIILKRIAGSCQ